MICKGRYKYESGALDRYPDCISDVVLLHNGEKQLSEAGFEPAPTFVDQNARSFVYECAKEGINLESGALDRSAILTACSTAHTSGKELVIYYQNLFFAV